MKFKKRSAYTAVRESFTSFSKKSATKIILSKSFGTELMEDVETFFENRGKGSNYNVVFYKAPGSR